jgi:hypothetical protein
VKERFTERLKSLVLNQKLIDQNNMKFLSIPLLFLVFFSCSFYSMGGSIPAHIKSIHIPLFENQTSEFGLAEDITDGIIEQFNESGVLKLVSQSSANSILKGKIRNISEGPYSYSKEESISEYRYKIDIEIEWFDIKNDKNILKSNYSGFGAYGVSGDIGSDGIDNDVDGKIDEEDDDESGEPRSFATKVAVRKIAEDILNDIMTTW